MKSTVCKRLSRVFEKQSKQRKVLIYGDYDCDGICAISTLMLYLRDKLDVFYFIPDRNKDGYGISVDALEKSLRIIRRSSLSPLIRA